MKKRKKNKKIVNIYLDNPLKDESRNKLYNEKLLSINDIMKVPGKVISSNEKGHIYTFRLEDLENIVSNRYRLDCCTINT